MGINRRSFVGGGLGLALGSALGGCGADPQQHLRVRMLQDSVPAQLVGAFRRQLQQGLPLGIIPEPQLGRLFTLLQRWQAGLSGTEPQGLGRLWPWPEADPVADVVTLGDSWLQAAITQNLIQPWPGSESWPSWQQLPQRWQAVGQRDDRGFPDPQGKIWAVPYRWGTTVIAYRQDQCQQWGWEPQDWGDLWREEVRGRLGLPDDSREVIGLALKALGYSYNHPQPATVPGLAEKLAQLQAQVRFYSSKTYLQPLLLGDVAVAVGWSTDLLPLLAYDRQLRLVVPASGTSLWADLWVRPTRATGDLAPVNQWINFCWDGAIVPKFSQLGHGTSPLLRGAEDLRLAHGSILWPPGVTLDRSEWIAPLPDSSLVQYQDLWETMRRSG